MVARTSAEQGFIEWAFDLSKLYVELPLFLSVGFDTPKIAS